MAAENRGQLGRAWCLTGLDYGRKPLGSRPWGCLSPGQVMGRILDVAGLGLLSNLKEIYAEMDEETAMAEFIGAWWEKFGSGAVVTAELYSMAVENDLLMTVPVIRENAAKK